MAALGAIPRVLHAFCLKGGGGGGGGDFLQIT